MGDERVELIRAAYESVSATGPTDRGGFDPEEIAPEVWARIDSEFELHERPDLPDAKAYRGPEESKAFFRKTADVFSEMRWEMGEAQDLGGAIVASVRIFATGRGSEAPVEFDEYNVWWFRNDRIIGLQAFGSEEEAIAAAKRPAPRVGESG